MSLYRLLGKEATPLQRQVVVLETQQARDGVEKGRIPLQTQLPVKRQIVCDDRPGASLQQRQHSRANGAGREAAWEALEAP